MTDVAPDSINIPIGQCVGVLGATSAVGRQILEQLSAANIRVVAFSRKHQSMLMGNTQWVKLDSTRASQLPEGVEPITYWIVASPIWLLSQYFPLMEDGNVQRIVCLSSTSRFTKLNSFDSNEGQVVQKLIQGEDDLESWASKQGVAWTILRPTLIYGRGDDRNLSEIIKIISRFKMFPLFGAASGLRQPIYVDDVAAACVQALQAEAAFNKSYNISGAEPLTYKAMLSRIFQALGLKPRFITINLQLYELALFFIRRIPRYRKWNSDMVRRMNQDMAFSHDEASQDFGFRPSPFRVDLEKSN